jgi:hypothetical protein
MCMYYVCISVKSALVKKNQQFNYTVRSVTLRKTSCVYVHFRNELFPTTAVQQRQHVHAVECRTFYRADQHICVGYSANSWWAHTDL